MVARCKGNSAFDMNDTIYSPRAPSGREVTPEQRFVEKLTASFGRPSTLYVVVAIAVTWMGLNLLLPSLGMAALDPFPFPSLQGAATISSLVIATMVLITQNRQLKLSEKRARLDLEINLTSERKIAKLIELVEELRRDLPNVRNRSDAEAEKMREHADPHAIAAELDRRIEAEVSAEADDPKAPEET